VPRHEGNALAGLLALVASGLIAAGALLPWFEIGDDTVSGWTASDDAKLLVGLACVGTVVSALLIGGARSMSLRLVLLVTGAAVLGVAVFDMVSVADLDDVSASMEIGLFLVLSGGTLLLAAGALARHRRTHAMS
jgi:hypothetical protein